MAAASSNELQHLPQDTQHRIRSTQIIVSLPQLVSELVQNALDADADQVDVGVDCEEWTCWVRDNGKGFSRQDLSVLEATGRYGEPRSETWYSTAAHDMLGTSKAYDAESLGAISTFGFRGEGSTFKCCLWLYAYALGKPWPL